MPDTTILATAPPVTKSRRLHPHPGKSRLAAARAWLRHLGQHPPYRRKAANELILKLARLELDEAMADDWGGVE